MGEWSICGEGRLERFYCSCFSFERIVMFIGLCSFNSITMCLSSYYSTAFFNIVATYIHPDLATVVYGKSGSSYQLVSWPLATSTIVAEN